jgi:hypothetical protein
MKTTTALIILSFAALCSSSCKKESEAVAGNAAPNTSAAVQHAPAHAKPGSYEDWCAEHQVPESLCTRCNASLVAAFKATGDWCAEHGLPESQCLACNPNLKIERPPRKSP